MHKTLALNYKGYSKSNAPNFIMYKQIIVATCIIHQKKGTSVRIRFLLLHIVSTSFKSYSPPMNEGMYTSVVELSRLMSKPIQVAIILPADFWALNFLVLGEFG